jgi:hypothetical protein
VYRPGQRKLCAWIKVLGGGLGKWYQNRNFTGRAYLGRDEEDGFTGPLTNQDADAMASILGFTERTSSDTGTSILIVNSVNASVKVQRVPV